MVGAICDSLSLGPFAQTLRCAQAWPCDESLADDGKEEKQQTKKQARPPHGDNLHILVEVGVRFCVRTMCM